ncbi:unnamed protein product [Rodentolepis nana]|uniref:ubiquitinyl hydrolase 1 n=1 Tax=Rodentolepis nana TaxID=102285 RepID=A0A0R3T9C8_RODNA|nr:unnamed protein product [Rodentolepis nana]
MQLSSSCASAERALNRLRIELCARLLENLDICDDPLPPSNEEHQKPVHFPGRWLPPKYFYDMFKSDSAFLVDARPREDYSRKRIVGIPQINVGGVIVSGLTITSLENRLNPAQLSEWNIHKSAKVIVLMDEDTGHELIDNLDDAENFQLPSRCPLKIIYDALVTYNAEKTAMPSTQFLAGGLEEFEKLYPTSVVMSSSHQSTSKSNLLSGINYGSLVDDASERVSDGSSTIVSSIDAPIDLEAGDDDSKPFTPYGELHRRLKENVDRKVHIHTQPSEDSSSVKSFKPVIDRSTKPQPTPQPFEPPEPKEEKPKVPEVNRLDKPQITTQNGDHSKNPTAYIRPRRPQLKQVPPITLERGLVNMGNTCYMNSSLQCLLHTPGLWNYFIQPDDAILGNQLVGQFVSFVRAMSNRGECATAFSPRELKSCFELMHPMFAGARQQDSQEFLVILLDSLHEALKVSHCSQFTFLFKLSIHENKTTSRYEETLLASPHNHHRRNAENRA